MGELLFKNENPNVPYRVYDPIDMRWALKGLEHLTPDKADISRLPEALPEPVKRAIGYFVNDAKVHRRWFCIKDGDLDDDQDEDILNTASYPFGEDGDQHLLINYQVHSTKGFHGPSPVLVKLLCEEN